MLSSGTIWRELNAIQAEQRRLKSHQAIPGSLVPSAYRLTSLDYNAPQFEFLRVRGKVYARSINPDTSANYTRISPTSVRLDIYYRLDGSWSGTPTSSVPQSTLGGNKSYVNPVEINDDGTVMFEFICDFSIQSGYESAGIRFSISSTGPFPFVIDRYEITSVTHG